MRWACAVTKELMEAAWPAVLGEWPETKEEFVRVADGEEQLLWNGPRVSMGMTYGKPQYRKPLNTGDFLPLQRISPKCVLCLMGPSAAYLLT